MSTHSIKPTKIKILLVEDETSIAQMLRFALPKERMIFFAVEDVAMAQAHLTRDIPDIVLLDWMLPDQSGISLIQWMKQDPLLKNTPIILLTARAAEADKVKGLKSGADDYLTKPFSPIELAARIDAILRRGTWAEPNEIIHYQQMTLDLKQHALHVQGVPLVLTALELKMLTFFLRHPHQIYTRDQLLSHLWGRLAALSDRTVDVAIRRLRDKLRPHGYNRMIETIRGTGYRLAHTKT